jgi:Protein of unknown function (DUF3307)
MIYFWSVILHFVGDYLIQSNWMANEKVNRWLPAWVHGVTYTLPFLLLIQSLLALSVICVTHVIIDHYRLAKHLIWVKNFLAPRSYPQPTWAEASTNGGFSLSTPPWMAIWLMILVDNTVHVLINSAALRYLA